MSSFLRALGLGSGTTLEDVVALAESLCGDPIEFVDRGDFRNPVFTSLWVKARDCRLILSREQDGPGYRSVGKLHELSHVLVMYATDVLPNSIKPSYANHVSSWGLMRLCAASDPEAPLSERRLEYFVERLAIELEHLIHGAPNRVDAYV